MAFKKDYKMVLSIVVVLIGINLTTQIFLNPITPDLSNKTSQKAIQISQKAIQISQKAIQISQKAIQISQKMQSNNDFVSKWNTSIISTSSSNTNQIHLPLIFNGTYNFTVFWGDGSNNTIYYYDQPDATHTYSNPGVYTVIINGIIKGWQFVGQEFDDSVKIIQISQWGNLNFGNSGYYFLGASNLVLTANDSPNLTGTTNLDSAFASCFNLGSIGNMESWNVSSVTSMSGMFAHASSFNQPLGLWNMSSVTDMSSMFSNTVSFNQPLGSWNVSSVTNMNFIFADASSFNQPLGSWNVASVTSMNSMFNNAVSFNQPLGSWNVSSVTDMYYMFSGDKLSIQNYDNLLQGWSHEQLQHNVYFYAGSSQYSSNSSEARQQIISKFGWNIIDKGEFQVFSLSFSQEVIGILFLIIIIALIVILGYVYFKLKRNNLDLDKITSDFYFKLKRNSLELDKSNDSDKKIANKIQKGQFPDFETYSMAKKVGASNSKQYQKILDYKAPDYPTVLEIEQGAFPDYDTYLDASKSGYKRFSDYTLQKSRETNLEQLTTRFYKISLKNFMIFMEFTSEKETIKWLLKLPKDNEIRIDGDMVVLNKSEPMKIDQNEFEFTQFLKEMEENKRC